MTKHPRIALIDDDEIFQFITSRLIERANLAQELKQFYNGDSALHYLNSHADLVDELPDIILLDINMPVIDGWMFLDEFKIIADKLDKVITIYMVSSSIAPEDINRAKSNPLVKDYLVKPVSMETLQAVLST
jgi:two-component system, chemotaxis family, chemotaxis protein CheY